MPLFCIFFFVFLVILFFFSFFYLCCFSFEFQTLFWVLRLHQWRGETKMAWSYIMKPVLWNEFHIGYIFTSKLFSVLMYILYMITYFFKGNIKVATTAVAPLYAKAVVIECAGKTDVKSEGGLKPYQGLVLNFFIKFSVYNRVFQMSGPYSRYLLFACSSFCFDLLCPWFKEACVLYSLPRLLIAPAFSGILIF